MKKFLSIFILTIICAFPIPTYAQNAVTFSAQPTSIFVSGTEGEKFHEDVLLQNLNAKESLPLRLYMENFYAFGNGTSVVFSSPNGSGSTAADWITPELPEVTLQPNEEQYATLDFSIPDYAQPGTYSVIFFIEPKIPPSATGSTLISREGVNILLTIYKNAAEYSKDYKSAIFENLSVPFFNLGNIELAGVIKNPGRFIISQDITITVSNIFGQTSASKIFSNIDVLPYQARYLNGKTEFIQLYSFFPGIYAVHVSAKDILKGNTISTTLYFTQVNMYFIMIGGAICLLLIIFISIYYVLHRRPKYAA